jgi:hypothetical protein
MIDDWFGNYFAEWWAEWWPEAVAYAATLAVCRTFVPAENRVFAVQAEDRVFEVRCE